MDEKKYLKLVRELLTPAASFIKVKKRITEENVKTDFLDNMILDEDSPSDFELSNSKIKWLPICITDYPKICNSMTANQAGYYALKKCIQQRWSFTDWKCCLTNLEMDM